MQYICNKSEFHQKTSNYQLTLVKFPSAYRSWMSPGMSMPSSDGLQTGGSDALRNIRLAACTSCAIVFFAAQSFDADDASHPTQHGPTDRKWQSYLCPSHSTPRKESSQHSMQSTQFLFYNFIFNQDYIWFNLKTK